jgi:hypothetical protein
LSPEPELSHHQRVLYLDLPPEDRSWWGETSGVEIRLLPQAILEILSRSLLEGNKEED